MSFCIKANNFLATGRMTTNVYHFPYQLLYVIKLSKTAVTKERKNGLYFLITSTTLM